MTEHPHFCDCDHCLNGTQQIAHKAETTWRRLRGPRLLPFRVPVGAE